VLLCQFLSILAKEETAMAQGWVNLGPGGGGWYRCAAFSPHEDKLIIGGDVSGVFVSTDYENFKIQNRDLINRVTQAIYFHPTDKDIVYLGTRGGVAKSTDGGETWQMKRNGFRPIETHRQTAPVYAITIDPRNPDIVYAGIGYERRFGRARATPSFGHLYKTTDAGESWSEMLVDSRITNESIMTIVIHPRDSKKLYVLSESKLFTSNDAGNTWTLKNTLPYDERIYTDLAVNRHDPSVLLLAYAERGASHETGVLKSTDGGATWGATSLTATYSDTAKGVKSITPHPSDANTFFANFHRDRERGVCVTHDAGTTWDIRMNYDPGRDTTIWSGWSEHATAFAISPRNPAYMCYVTDMEIYLTRDGGKTWALISSKRVPDKPDFYTSSGADILCATSVGITPDDPEELYLGYRDVALWKTHDGGKSVTKIKQFDTVTWRYGDVYSIVFDPDASNIVYISRELSEAVMAVFRTTDSGETWTPLGTGLDTNGLIVTMAIAPTGTISSRTLYAGQLGSGIYKSTDSGKTWTARNNGLPANKMIYGIALDPTNHEVIYICARFNNSVSPSDGYVAKSTDGGNTWRVVLSGLDARSVAVDPSNPKIIYAGNRDFSGLSRNEIFWRSIDGGRTWSSLPGETFNVGYFERDLPRYYCLNTIAVDPRTPGRVYAGLVDDGRDYTMGGGVWYSDDYGENWDIFDREGLACFGITSLIVDPVDGSRIYAATAGTGIWRYGPDPVHASTER